MRISSLIRACPSQDKTNKLLALTDRRSDVLPASCLTVNHSLARFLRRNRSRLYGKPLDRPYGSFACAKVCDDTAPYDPSFYPNFARSSSRFHAAPFSNSTPLEAASPSGIAEALPLVEAFHPTSEIVFPYLPLVEPALFSHRYETPQFRTKHQLRQRPPLAFWFLPKRRSTRDIARRRLLLPDLIQPSSEPDDWAEIHRIDICNSPILFSKTS